MVLKGKKANPDILTAHLANGGNFDGGEMEWAEQSLSALREMKNGGASIPIADLRHIYMMSRIIQGGIVASHLALPTTIDVSKRVRNMSLPADLDGLADLGMEQTEAFITGAENGKPRDGNDFPPDVKRYIAGIAGLLSGSFEKSYLAFEKNHPALLTLAHNADEIQRLSWALIRSLIDKVISDEEVALYRKKPLREGTNELVNLVNERIGITLPVRVMQRDNWAEALEAPRQDPRVAVFNDMVFFVENAEVAMLYCLGPLLVRLKLGAAPEEALKQHIRYGAQDIAAGTYRLTHAARFQSRIGARPNSYRSFAEFLRNVNDQASGASLADDGRIDWNEPNINQRRGWCPAQNSYENAAGEDMGGFAIEGRDAVQAWKEHGRKTFGIEPAFSKPTPAELLGCAIIFAVMHEGSPLRPEFLQDMVHSTRR